MDWNVRLTMCGEVTETQIDDTLRTLADYGAVLSGGPGFPDHELIVTVEAPGISSAVQAGLGLLHLVHRKRSDVVKVVAVPQDLQGDARLDPVIRPTLLGTSEAADVLGVTKQRVQQLMHTAAFPKPRYRLRATPVWLAQDIHDFALAWERKTGRPKKRSAVLSRTARRAVAPIGGN